MSEVYKIMQVSNSTSGYRAGDRVYIGYINSRGEYIESGYKTNMRTGKSVRTSGYMKNVGNVTINQNGNIVRRARRLSTSRRR